MAFSAGNPLKNPPPGALADLKYVNEFSGITPGQSINPSDNPGLVEGNWVVGPGKSPAKPPQSPTQGINRRASTPTPDPNRPTKYPPVIPPAPTKYPDVDGNTYQVDRIPIAVGEDIETRPFGRSGYIHAVLYPREIDFEADGLSIDEINSTAFGYEYAPNTPFYPESRVAFTDYHVVEGMELAIDYSIPAGRGAENPWDNGPDGNINVPDFENDAVGGKQRCMHTDAIGNRFIGCRNGMVVVTATGGLHLTLAGHTVNAITSLVLIPGGRPHLFIALNNGQVLVSLGDVGEANYFLDLSDSGAQLPAGDAVTYMVANGSNFVALTGAGRVITCDFSVTNPLSVHEQIVTRLEAA